MTKRVSFFYRDVNHHSSFYWKSDYSDQIIVINCLNISKGYLQILKYSMYLYYCAIYNLIYTLYMQSTTATVQRQYLQWLVL